MEEKKEQKAASVDVMQDVSVTALVQAPVQAPVPESRSATSALASTNLAQAPDDQKAPVATIASFKPLKAATPSKPRAASPQIAARVGQTRYKRHKKIGDGVSGDVYLCFDTIEKTQCAIKYMTSSGPDEVKQIKTEIKSLVMCERHANVVTLLDVFTEEENQYRLVFEYAEGGTLDTAIAGNPQPMGDIQNYARQLLSGLAHCHSRGIVHCDLKPHNILRKGGQLKIADFGLAHIVEDGKGKLTKEIVTRWYRAPELMVDGTTVTTAVDIWAAGCIIAEMYYGHPLFMSRSSADHMAQVYQVLGVPDDDVWPGYSTLKYHKWSKEIKPLKPPVNMFTAMDSGLADLLTRMLTFSPQSRITAVKALNHPFVAWRRHD